MCKRDVYNVLHHYSNDMMTAQERSGRASQAAVLK